MKKYKRLAREREFAIIVNYDSAAEAQAAALVVPFSTGTVVMAGERGWAMITRARTAAGEMALLALLPSLGGTCAYFGDYRDDLAPYTAP